MPVSAGGVSVGNRLLGRFGVLDAFEFHQIGEIRFVVEMIAHEGLQRRRVGREDEPIVRGRVVGQEVRDQRWIVFQQPAQSLEVGYGDPVALLRLGDPHE